MYISSDKDEIHEAALRHLEEEHKLNNPEKLLSWFSG